MRTIDWRCEYKKADHSKVKEISERLSQALDLYYAAGGGNGFSASSVSMLTRDMYEALGIERPDDMSEAIAFAVDIAEEVVKYGIER